MPARKSGISAATLVLSDEFGHMIDMPFLTIHLRSRQGPFSVSASDACASLAFARGTAVMLASPYMANAYHAASLFTRSAPLPDLCPRIVLQRLGNHLAL